MQFTQEYIDPEVNSTFLPEPKTSGFNIPVPSAQDYTPKDNTNSIGNLLDNFYSKPDIQAQMSPITFNWDESNADRYVHSPDYKSLGFDPYGTDEEGRYAASQSGLSKLGNTLGGFGVGMKDAFVNQFTSWKDTASIFQDPTLQSAFKEDELNEVYKKNLDLENRFPIYKTQKDQSDFFTWNNFLNAFKNTGPLIGSLAEIGTENLAVGAITAATLGAAAPLEAVEIAKTTAQVVEDAQRFTRSMDPIANLRNSWNTFKESKSVSDAWDVVKNTSKLGLGAVDNTVTGFIPLGNTIREAGNVAKSGATIRTIGAGFGAFYADMRDLNLSISMAQANAANMYNDLTRENIKYFKDQNGRDPNDIELQGIKDNSLAAAKKDGALNALAILMLNKFAFHNILTSNKALQDYIADNGEGFANKIGINRFAKEGEDKLYVKTGGWKGFKQTLFNFDYGNAVGHGLGFGVTMNAMQAVDNTVKSYYNARYNHRNISWADAVADGIDSQFSKEGANTFMSGFLTGAIVPGILGKAFNESVKEPVITSFQDLFSGVDKSARQERQTDVNTKAKDFTDKFNKFWKDPLSENIPNVILQSEFNAGIKNSLAKGDKNTAEDYRGDATKLFMIDAAKNKFLKVFTDHIGDYANSLDKEELYKKFYPDQEFDQDRYNELRDKITNFQKQAYDIDKTYKNLLRDRPNPYNPYKYQDGTQDRDNERYAYNAYQEALGLAAYAKATTMETVERQNNILNGTRYDRGIAKLDGFKDLGFTTIYSLADQKKLGDEINILKKELAVTDPNSDQYKEVNFKINRYQEHLDLLTNYQKEYLDTYNEENNNKRENLQKDLDDKYNDKVQESLGKIVDHEQKLAGRDVIPTEDLESSSKKYLDYYKLTAKHGRILGFSNFILDPPNWKRYTENAQKFQAENAKEQAQEWQKAQEKPKTESKKPVAQDIDYTDLPPEAYGVNPEDIGKPIEEPDNGKPIDTTVNPIEQNKVDNDVDAHIRANMATIPSEGKIPDSSEYKPRMVPSGLLGTTGKHFNFVTHQDGSKEDTTPNNNENMAGTYLTFSNLVLKGNGMNFVTVINKGNDKLNLLDPAYPNAIKVYLSDLDGNPVDLDGKVIDNPSKDNVNHLPLPEGEYLKGDLLNPNDPGIERAIDFLKKQRNTTDWTDDQLRNEILKYREFIYNIKKGLEDKGDYRLRIVGKRQGIVDTIKGSKQPVSDRIIDPKTNWVNLYHPNGMRIDIEVRPDGGIHFIREDNQVFPVYTRELLDHEKDNIINTLKYLTKVEPKSEEDVKLRTILHSMMFFGEPIKTEDGLWANVGRDRVWVDFKNKRIYRSFAATNEKNERIIEKIDFPFNEKSLDNVKNRLLEGLYFNFNNSLSNTFNEPFIERTTTEKNGEYKIKDIKRWENYSHYTMANPEDREESLKKVGVDTNKENSYNHKATAPPVHTNVSLWTSDSPQLKRVDLNLEDFNEGKTILPKKIIEVKSEPEKTTSSEYTSAQLTVFKNMSNYLNTFVEAFPDSFIEELRKDGSTITPTDTGFKLIKSGVEYDVIGEGTELKVVGGRQVAKTSIEPAISKVSETLTEPDKIAPADIKDVPNPELPVANKDMADDLVKSATPSKKKRDFKKNEPGC